jgi:hypothetical protein
LGLYAVGLFGEDVDGVLQRFAVEAGVRHELRGPGREIAWDALEDSEAIEILIIDSNTYG